tara:strand:- start:3092 stop:4015 length:924 start_codon:yes stop_codon:yes gene_type:complete
MGYTHYADIPTGRIDDKQWSNLQNEIMALTIGQPTEYIPQVIITKELIQVQGQHEWFTIQREPKAPEWKPDGMAFEFTKTARKPYDYIIVACYMSLYRCVKGVKLSSDGDYHELADGRAHFADVFGYNDDELFGIFVDTIHDPRPEWYVGDPCYAINDYFWQDFCAQVNTYSHDALEGDGVEFDFNGYRAYVYNSGLGGDGSFTVKGLHFGVDAGLLSVLPAQLVGKEMNGGGHMVRSRLRPVFEIDTDNFPHISLSFGGSTQFANDGHIECDGCGEWRRSNDTWSNNDGETVCVECYEEEEEGEDY